MTLTVGAKTMVSRKSGLGKNLNVLLGNTKVIAEKKAQNTLQKLPIEKLQPGAYQPRRDMSQDSLAELAASIKQQGLLQPIVVRKLTPEKYEIIAGERRWRASKLAGLLQVPVVVQQVDDKTSLAMAIVENIQREDLNPMDEARGLSRLINEFNLTHLQVAEVVSKSRASVTNLLRLMNLHPDVQLMLERGDIEMGHARALLALEGLKQKEIARLIVEKNLSVREAEAVIRKLAKGNEQAHPKSELLQHHAEKRQARLVKQLGTAVKIKPSPAGKYKIEIIYDSLEGVDEFIASIGA